MYPIDAGGPGVVLADDRLIVMAMLEHEHAAHIAARGTGPA